MSTNSERSKRTAATVDSHSVTVRMSAKALQALDDWRLRQSDAPGRPEAVRRLVDAGLAANHEATQQLHEAKSHAEIASKLAAEIGLTENEGRYRAPATCDRLHPRWGALRPTLKRAASDELSTSD